MDSQYTQPPARANFSGCFIALGIVILLGIVAVIGIFGFVRLAAKENNHTSEVSQTAKIDGTVYIQKSELNSYSITDFGETLTEEHYIANAAVDDMTSLGKKTFAEKANGTRVKWLLRVIDIQKKNTEPKTIEGQFELPYKIRSGNSTSGSAIRVEASFAPDSSPQLIVLRKGDWVEVSGNIRFGSNSRTVIFDSATIVLEAKIEPEAEIEAVVPE